MFAEPRFGCAQRRAGSRTLRAARQKPGSMFHSEKVALVRVVAERKARGPALATKHRRHLRGPGPRAALKGRGPMPTRQENSAMTAEISW